MRIVDEGVKERRYHERIFQVVLLFQNISAALLWATSAVPHIPLVPRDVDGPTSGIVHEGRLNKTFGDLCLLVQVEGTRQELIVVVVAVSHIEMQREIVNI